MGEADGRGQGQVSSVELVFIRFLRQIPTHLWPLEEDVPCGKADQACSTLMTRSFDGRVPSTIYRGSLEGGDSGSMAVVAGVRLIHDAERLSPRLLRRSTRGEKPLQIRS